MLFKIFVGAGFAAEPIARCSGLDSIDSFRFNELHLDLM